MPNENLLNLPDFKSEYSSLFNAIRKVVPVSMKIYLVGGAVRDILLGRKIRDFDFSVEGLVRPIGKSIANELNGAYYVLDDEREMVRVIFDDEEKGQFDVDIALLEGDDIEEDLRARDFTLNAMAIELSPVPAIVDPLGGWSDLQNRMLRMCSPSSLEADPMRAMRAVRMSLEFDLQMDEQLADAMRSVRSSLHESSMERYRDELFKIVRLNKNAQAIRICEDFGFLEYLFPGMKKNKEGIDFSQIKDADFFIDLLTIGSLVTDQTDDYVSYASSRLGNYREILKGFFGKTLALYHTRRMLTSFTAIVKTLSDGDITGVKHWCNRLAFSSAETNYVLLTLLGLSYLNTVDDIDGFSDVDIYNYFRQYKEGGIAALVLYLAESYSNQDIPEAYKHWCDRVVFVQDLITAYFTRYMEVIAPQPLLSGTDIQNLLGMPSGPIIGFVKNALIEAQIRGSVKTIPEAESFVRQQAKHYG